MNNINYNEAIDDYDSGESVIIRVSHLYHYKVENGKTYVIVSESGDSDGLQDDSGDYSVVQFDGDQRDNLPNIDEYFFFRGVVKEDNNGHKYIEGKEILLVNSEYPLLITIHSFNYLILILVIYFLLNFRYLKKLLKITNLSNDDDN